MLVSWSPTVYDAVMTVYLDDEAIEVPPGDLDCALEAAAKKLASSGRLVVEVRLEGQELVGDDLDQRRHDPVDQSELRLYSADPRQLALTALQETLIELDTVGQAQSPGCRLTATRPREQAMHEVGAAVNTWIRLQQALSQSIELLGISLDQVSIDGVSTVDLIGGLAEQLKQLRGLLEARDVIGIADALAYEWPQSVDQWGQLIQALIDRARESQ